MKKTKIIEVLKKSGKPLTIEQLSEKTGVPVPRLRMDLFRLQGEGEVESRQKGDELLWTIKVAKPVEERYEKMRKKPTT
ncbi:hypothetical protein AKJ48_00685 [candidate division MSBL1 archaeon SCGC-AAA261O19]|uniref:Helix-turn-helix type 11 domain-containing protein n=2 Tax=candidate division MSBL1 TaxID=215777 RepID=A0A133V2G1_9EURY|nr:hypothetical protein AKJ42_00140 [candidate division MSBL1 archaeon SCGC-AAA261C02]KXB04995.1 hypothetical protein AKJ48_00685 [candidate division MSBL1 archaeon SCGC-AAA261O19]